MCQLGYLKIVVCAYTPVARHCILVGAIERRAVHAFDIIYQAAMLYVLALCCVLHFAPLRYTARQAPIVEGSLAPLLLS